MKDGEELPFYTADGYQEEGTPLVILAGKMYGPARRAIGPLSTNYKV